MVGEAVEKKLYDAASRGDLATFQQLLRRDPYLLDGVSFAGSRNLLHIATIWGHAAIVEEVLAINPRLARNLDSEKSSPLHMAAAAGHTQIAKTLSSVAREMCWWRDCQGMNPIHIAAMKGHVEILDELIRLDPIPAREKVGRGETVMHLCVKHHQLEALKFLANKFGDLVGCGDDDGETLLHLAARYKQLEIIEYLARNKKIDKRPSTNAKGETPLEIVIKSPDPDPTTSEIKGILIIEQDIEMSGLIKWNEFLMVVVILIATMAFQAAVSPPGGVWQQDSSLHKTGEAVMASKHPQLYKHFVRANTVAFVSSMIAIILLTTTLPAQNFSAMALTLYATWVSVTSIAVSYGASVMVITPYTQTPSFNLVIHIVIVVCVVPYGMFGVYVVLIALIEMRAEVLGDSSKCVLRKMRRRYILISK